MDMGLSKLRELVVDREAWCAVVRAVIKSHSLKLVFAVCDEDSLRQKLK